MSCVDLIKYSPNLKTCFMMTLVLHKVIFPHNCIYFYRQYQLFKEYLVEVPIYIIELFVWIKSSLRVSHGLCSEVLVLSCSSYPTLCDPMDCSLPGSFVHGIFQARILEWVAISFSRGSSRPRNQTCTSCIAGEFFTHWAIREVHLLVNFLNMVEE